MRCLPQTLPSRLMEEEGREGYVEEEAERFLRSRSWWITLNKKHPSNTTGITHIWTHRNCYSRHKTDKIPAPRRGSGHKGPSQTKKLLAIATCWEKEIIFPQGSLTGYINFDPGQARARELDSINWIPCFLFLWGFWFVLVFLSFVLFVMFFFFFKKERTWSWVSREVGRIWGGCRGNIMEIHSMRKQMK